MKILNKRAAFDYQLLERFEAGINLYGAEVKAVRLGLADFSGSFVRVQGSEVYLVNAKIFPYKYARPESYDESRTRKLLMHKKQILSLKSKVEAQNLTIVPVSLYTTHSFIKLELALGRGKKEYMKRESIRRRDIQREVEEEFRAKLK